MDSASAREIPLDTDSVRSHYPSREYTSPILFKMGAGRLFITQLPVGPKEIHILCLEKFYVYVNFPMESPLLFLPSITVAI